jgi:lipopolysaccharide transport system ATP-binding protein
METGAVLFVSHDTGAILNLCNKAILLENSCVVKTGSPKSVAEYYLSNIYADTQDGGYANNTMGTDDIQQDWRAINYRDMREDMINQSKLRNDIEIFRFNPNSSGFGLGGAEIQNVQLLDNSNHPLAWIVGGEDVVLTIKVKALCDFSSPIIGFHFKDRLGQVIFADNTYLVYRNKAVHVSSGEVITARFSFRMPILPNGDYTVDVAIATGTQESHVQRHWVHDAIALRVQASSLSFGLIGVSMKYIDLEVN